MGTMKIKIGMGVRFSPFTMQRLRQVCKVEGLSKGQLVREAVDRDLERRIRNRIKAVDAERRNQ